MRVIGVDGCPCGWVVAEWDDSSRVFEFAFRRTFQDVLDGTADVECVGIDLPIGLADGPPRGCDLAARALLGPRRSSVFPAPIRPVLDAADHRSASEIARAVTGKGISIQAFNIIGKVAEVDAVMRENPLLQSRVIEVHPEVSFCLLNGGVPMSHSKKRTAGFAERQALLTSVFPSDQVPLTRRDARAIAPYAGPDDLLDAVVACWSARRAIVGQVVRLPEDPPVDHFGLLMRIVA